MRGKECQLFLCFMELLFQCIIMTTNNKHRLVQAWIELHRDELIANWSLAVSGQNIYSIDPLK